MLSSKTRWISVLIFFFFMLLHQSDRLLIGPLTIDIIDEFQITKAQMGAVFTGALLVGAFAFPLWGYLYDRFSRAKLLSLASLLWGATTWISAIAPTYGLFVASRSSTGIDDSSYPGIYSLISDYFNPKVRGRIYGLLQFSHPLGYLMGMLLALFLGGAIGWRSVFILTGGLGILLAVVIFFGVREAPRGNSEPELADIEQISSYRFDLKIARDLFKKPTLLLLFTQGFFGVFPWNVITYWFFAYLEQERGYTDDMIMITMVPAVLALAAGYPLGGVVGDFLFKRTSRGRVIVSSVGVITGAILLMITMNIPPEEHSLFLGMLMVTAIFIPLAAANVLSTIFDITLPEVRSTAHATLAFIESMGAALAPLIAGIIADRYSLHDAIVILSVSAWVICFVFFIFTAIVVPKDIAVLRDQMHQRAIHERSKIG